MENYSELTVKGIMVRQILKVCPYCGEVYFANPGAFPKKSRCPVCHGNIILGMVKRAQRARNRKTDDS